MTIHDELLQIAERHHGVIGRHHLVDIGADRYVWRRLVRSTEWQRLSGLVVRRRGTPETPQQRLSAAVLDGGAGAALYGRSAAAHWGIPGYTVRAGDDIDVVRDESAPRRRSTLAQIHTSVRMSSDRVRTLDDIAVTSPAQTILDLARHLHPLAVERALDHAWAMNLISGPSLRAELERVAISGRDGVVAVRELLEERGDDYVPPASGLEARFAQILRWAGQRPMRRQVNVGADRWVGRVDFLDDELPLIAEINSQRFHSALVDRRHDERRMAELRRASFVVLEIWDVDVWSCATDVVARVAAARRELRAARGAA